MGFGASIVAVLACLPFALHRVALLGSLLACSCAVQALVLCCGLISDALMLPLNWSCSCCSLLLLLSLLSLGCWSPYQAKCTVCHDQTLMSRCGNGFSPCVDVHRDWSAATTFPISISCGRVWVSWSSRTSRLGRILICPHGSLVFISS